MHWGPLWNLSDVCSLKQSYIGLYWSHNAWFAPWWPTLRSRPAVPSSRVSIMQEKKRVNRIKPKLKSLYNYIAPRRSEMVFSRNFWNWIGLSLTQKRIPPSYFIGFRRWIFEIYLQIHYSKLDKQRWILFWTILTIWNSFLQIRLRAAKAKDILFLGWDFSPTQSHEFPFFSFSLSLFSSFISIERHGDSCPSPKAKKFVHCLWPVLHLICVYDIRFSKTIVNDVHDVEFGWC